MEFYRMTCMHKLVMRHKLMFSDTVSGRCSMVRQLQPNLHLDEDSAAVKELEGKIKMVKKFEVDGVGYKESISEALNEAFAPKSST